jgi:hypothetical protein
MASNTPEYQREKNRAYYLAHNEHAKQRTKAWTRRATESRIPRDQ